MLFRSVYTPGVSGIRQDNTSPPGAVKYPLDGFAVTGICQFIHIRLNFIREKKGLSLGNVNPFPDFPGVQYQGRLPDLIGYPGGKPDIQLRRYFQKSGRILADIWLLVVILKPDIRSLTGKGLADTLRKSCSVNKRPIPLRLHPVSRIRKQDSGILGGCSAFYAVQAVQGILKGFLLKKDIREKREAIPAPQHTEP